MRLGCCLHAGMAGAETEATEWSLSAAPWERRVWKRRITDYVLPAVCMQGTFGMEMEKQMEYRDRRFTEERALFGSRDLTINGCVFDVGESPLKESRKINASQSLFRYKYPFWYCEDIDLERVTFFEMARAGVWYTKRFSMKNSIVEAPKNFRRCEDISLTNVMIPHAEETLWFCRNVNLEGVKANGPYFAMGSSHVRVKDLDLIGDYSFDGVVDCEVWDSHLASKDAFWNTSGVVIRNSFITGEYLGWNAKDLTLIDCTIESLQGMCYIDNLVMKNCRLINTNLAFEYCSVDADLKGSVDSVFNPKKGIIRADHIEHLVMQEGVIDPGDTEILCESIGDRRDTPDGLW